MMNSGSSIMACMKGQPASVAAAGSTNDTPRATSGTRSVAASPPHGQRPVLILLPACSSSTAGWSAMACQSILSLPLVIAALVTCKLTMRHVPVAYLLLVSPQVPSSGAHAASGTSTFQTVISCFPTANRVDQGDQELGDTAVVIASLAAAPRPTPSVVLGHTLDLDATLLPNHSRIGRNC